MPIAPWRSIDWAQTLGGNDRYSDCVFVALANFLDVRLAPQIVAEGEIERFYSIETGFEPGVRATDKGAVLEAVLKDWVANGWPSDPTIKPVAYGPISANDMPVAIATSGSVPAWLLLPAAPADDESDWDFSDRAVDNAVPGTGAHAVLVVYAAEAVTFVTWGKAVTVSQLWWRKYAQQAYAVVFAVSKEL
jgi:hypothetical protein